MKIPKYVQKLIDDRCNLAVKLFEVSSKLDNWLEKNNISLDGDYTRTGCMIYIEPDTARECVMQDILNKE